MRYAINALLTILLAIVLIKPAQAEELFVDRGVFVQVAAITLDREAGIQAVEDIKAATSDDIELVDFIHARGNVLVVEVVATGTDYKGTEFALVAVLSPNAPHFAYSLVTILNVLPDDAQEKLRNEWFDAYVGQEI